MKAYHYIFLFSLIFIIKEIDGSDGMISCAWGSHKVKRVSVWKFVSFYLEFIENTLRG